MWIAIVYERTTEVIAWNVRATKDDSVRWVRNTFDTAMAFDQRDDDTALSEIDAAEYVVHIEEVAHLSTDVQHGIRFPNGMISQQHEHAIPGAVYEANKALFAAQSPDRVERVTRAVMFTDWRHLA